jgi:hypothetical protein
MIPAVTPRSRRFAPVYAGWLLGCALLFGALRYAEDPSRRAGRILSNEAGARAVAILRSRDAARFASFEPVHVAYASAKEEGEARWVVLCDRVPHSALREAVVVELRAADGALVTLRRPAME